MACIISFEGEVDGKGFRIENINTKLVGQISQIVFNEYNYKDISVNGLYQNNLFNGKLASTDVNLNGTFEGLADLSEEINKFDFKATINYANLRALNLYDRDSISELKVLMLRRICILTRMTITIGKMLQNTFQFS